MPLSETGREVLGKMRKKYGKDKGEEVFYATINKHNPGSEKWHEKGAVLGKNKK
jgi:hypothetical protein